MLTTSIIILALFVCAFGGFVVYDLATAKRQRVVYRVKSSVTAYLMLLPSVALAFLFILLPILYYIIPRLDKICFLWYNYYQNSISGGIVPYLYNSIISELSWN